MTRLVRHLVRTAPAISCLLATMLSAPVADAGEDVAGADPCMRVMNAGMAEELKRSTRGLSTSAATSDTIWIGYQPAQSGNYWRVGVGPARGGVDEAGMWTFDTPVHGDSLQGWWPLRRSHLNFTGATLTDENRPWWAVAYGNVANYVLPARRDRNDPSAPGNRTFGVVGVWHRDPGNVISASIPGTSPVAPGWTPLEGSYSAWMGIRSHGDLTAFDPETGNYFNAAMLPSLQFGNVTSGFADMLLPGYVGDMDQMLYRDVDLSSAPADSSVRLRFTFRTRMSMSKDTSPSFRTGWHEGDQLSQNQVTPGNFVSAEAGTPANSQAPVDSFQVYIGAPVNDAAWETSVADTRPVYDPQRRWFNEILRRGHRRWLYGVAGDRTATTVTLQLPAAEKNALLAAAAAAGHPNRLRIVFRVHTNRAFDDAAGGIGGNYNSGGVGAAIVDDVRLTAGVGEQIIGNFEAANAIDNDPAVSALSAWKSTGKPPDPFMHVHDVATLVYQDICGPVGGANRVCDLRGNVISMGLHELNEATSDPSPLSTAHEGYWGVMSPTINLKTAGPSTPNGWGLTGDMVDGADDIAMIYDIYTGIFDVFTQGQLWQECFQSYPATQSNGVKTWGPITVPGCLFFNPEKQCFRMSGGFGGYSSSTIRTSNPGGRPDSLRAFFQKMSQCYRFGVTTGCSATDGGYLDNISIGLIHNAEIVLANMDLWDVFHDTFPANETAGLPGTSAFDTTAAHIKIGLNIAPTTGTLNRYNVPGDSLTITSQGDSLRLDLLFRVMPGPGNYVAIGNRASGLRKVPTSTAMATAGDGSFWGSFMNSPGTQSGAPGTLNPGLAAAYHLAAPSGWSEIVWNSARMDSAELTTLFPVQSRGIGMPPTGAMWASIYHESELASRPTLGIVRNRCFTIDTLVSNINDANVNCGRKTPYPPAWVTSLPASRTGWDGTTVTNEGTKIIPDGLLTPGAHVQYFVRRQLLSDPPSVFQMSPDTNLVYPQFSEGPNTDGHRWQQFAVLPDRWKDPAFGAGGVGMACMLVVDWADRRGDERVWKGVADSIGSTAQTHVGNADGYGHVPGNGDVNDPQYRIPHKNRQMGTLWDMYQVKAGESLTTAALSPGGRLGHRAAGFLMDDGVPNGFGTGPNGKWTYNPPTPEMLRTYYKQLVVLTGDLNSQIVGPYTDRSGDDVALLQDWLQSGSPSMPTRGLLVMGDGFVTAANDFGGQQDAFVRDFLGASLVNDNYLLYASNVSATPRLSVTAAINGGLDARYGVRNLCVGSLDVLDRNALLNASIVGSYEDAGGTGPYGAIIMKPHSVSQPWIALTTGFRIGNVRSWFGDNGHGRLALTYNVLSNVFGSICTMVGSPVVTLDTPQANSGRPFIDFAGIRNNPVRTGFAVVQFGLAEADRVEIAIYDISGRKVRTLADRWFAAGPHEIHWDGRGDAGARLDPGVYFTRVRYEARGFETARKVTVLR